MSSLEESNTMPNKRQKVGFDTSNDDMLAELAAEEAEWMAARDVMWDAIDRADEVRKRIREAGVAEFDSLLNISRDSLSHVLKFLDIKMLGRL